MTHDDLFAFLDKLHEEGQRNDAREQERSKKMLNLEPETAFFLSILVRSAKRQRILEIGTSNGYSTIWLAWAAQASDGHVTSIERNPDKSALAQENLSKAGLLHMVDLLCGEATEQIAQLSGPFDCVFFDADRRSAPQQLHLLLPKLTPDVFILADNVLSHPDEIADYLAELAKLPRFERLTLPIGKGLSVAYRQSY
jgi:predicted O-methyltransferase YrrM